MNININIIIIMMMNMMMEVSWNCIKCHHTLLMQMEFHHLLENFREEIARSIKSAADKGDIEAE